ncbi:MAG: sensor histidine kinase N-terminal domain-containing protein, partial [Burkholderiaceae bacterium]
MPDEGPRTAAPLTPVVPAAVARAGADSARSAPRKRYVNPLRPFSEQRSLFGEILDWMLAPLLLLWPMSVALTFVVAELIASAPFDRNLGETASILAGHLKIPDGQVRIALPLSAREILRADPDDSVYYMVLGLRGEFIAGDLELPLPAEDEIPAPRVVRFRAERLRGEEIRVAYTWVEFNTAAGPRYALVQVAETLQKRSHLANEIIRGVIIPQFFVLPLAVLLVWFGLSRGLAPLATLQTLIRSRKPDDLSPIDPTAAPEEISPLVASFNDLLARLAQNLRAQQRFLADAAHQMKTPLAGLRTQAELALRETDPDELRRTLRHIARATERTTHLTNQLLALARAEHRSSSNHFEVVELVSLAREIVRELVPEAIAHALDLGFEASERPIRILAAPLLIQELLK